MLLQLSGISIHTWGMCLTKIPCNLKEAKNNRFHNFRREVRDQSIYTEMCLKSQILHTIVVTCKEFSPNLNFSPSCIQANLFLPMYG